MSNELRQCQLNCFQKSWMQNPLTIIDNWWQIFPFESMPRGMKINSATRCLILFYIICKIFEVEHSDLLFLVGILVLIIINFLWTDSKYEPYDSNMTTNPYGISLPYAQNRAIAASKGKTDRIFDYSKYINGSSDNFDWQTVNTQTQPDFSQSSNQQYMDSSDYAAIQNNAQNLTPMQPQIQQNSDNGAAMKGLIPIKTAENSTSTAALLDQLQPNVYTFTAEPESANANIGITETNGFPPRTELMDDAGNTVYYRLQQDYAGDLSSYSRPKVVLPAAPANNPAKIYNTTYTGYGRPAFSIYNPEIGQNSYLYEQSFDTPDAKPLYLTRSNLDFIEYTDPMGRTNPILETSIGVETTQDVAMNSFYNDSTNFRNDISEKLMRKQNAIAWQNKLLPRGRQI